MKGTFGCRYRQYLHRFELDDSSNCPDCSSVPDDPEHVMFHYLPKKMTYDFLCNYKNTGRTAEGSKEEENPKDQRCKCPRRWRQMADIWLCHQITLVKPFSITSAVHPGSLEFKILIGIGQNCGSNDKANNAGRARRHNESLYMYDNETKLGFLIDTGAELSILTRLNHCKGLPSNSIFRKWFRNQNLWRKTA